MIKHCPACVSFIQAVRTLVLTRPRTVDHDVAFAIATTCSKCGGGEALGEGMSSGEAAEAFQEIVKTNETEHELQAMKSSQYHRNRYEKRRR